MPNVLVVGAPGGGKSFAAASDAVNFQGAVVVLDPHKDSLAQLVLMHARGNVLFDRLSDVKHSLGYDLLKPSANCDPVQRQMENHRRAQIFVEIMLRRRGTDGIAATPLLEEWILALLMMFLFQANPKPLGILPYGFMPGTSECTALIRDCILPEIRHKFHQLEKLNPRALRAEVGSASRVVTAIFRSPAFLVRSRGGFDLGSFLQNRGTLIVEKGDEIDDDAMRTIMCGISTLVTDHAKSRKVPRPWIRIYLDECVNARTAGTFEERAAAETRKSGLSWYFMSQLLNYPNGPDGFLQNCLRHEVFKSPHYELARKMATDMVAAMPLTEESRAERVARLAHDIMNLPPGWRWVRDASGTRKEYVPMLENPWPDWPGLREAKLQEKLQCIYARLEYRAHDEAPSENFSPPETPRSTKSPDVSSPAKRLKRRERKPADGSANSADESSFE